MKKLIDKIKRITTKQIIVIALFCLNFGLFIYNAFYEWYNNKHVLAVVFAVAFFLVELVSVALYFFLKNKKKMPIEKIFVFIALILGVFHVFITPFNQVPDEITHIFRVYDISDGNIVSHSNGEGEFRAEMSSSSYKLLNNAQTDLRYYKKVIEQLLESTSEEKWGWNFSSAVIYKPVAYLPQTTGVVMGKILHLPAAVTLYLGRIFALVAYVAIMYFAIKNTPKFKNFFVLFALLPMALQQGMAYSPDCLAIALGFLLVSIAIRAIYGKEKVISTKTLGIIYVTVLALAAIKSLAYLPIALILVLIPYKKFGKWWIKYLHLSLLLIIPVISYYVWGKIQDPALYNEPNVVASGLSLVEFLVMSVGSFFGTRTLYYVDGMFGRSLSYSNFNAPIQVYIFIMIAIVTVMVVRTNEKLEMKKLDKLVYWAIPIITVLTFYYIAAYNWGYFGDDRESSIIGIQGRYFLPLLPLIPLLSYYNKKKTTPLSVDYVFIFAILSNFAILGSKFLHNI